MKQLLRPIKIVKGYIRHAEGSCLFSMGKTTVLCVASVEDERPPHAEEQNMGWVTAEYAMLPRAGDRRTPRGKASGGGRAQEISRLVGRSLRAIIELEKLGERTVTIDCDVICADGGTRTAAINGGMIALAEALKKLRRDGTLPEWPLKDVVGAVSVGMVKGRPILDLNYENDHIAETDFNFVMTGSGRFVEIQGTAEKIPFTGKESQALKALAVAGIRKIILQQKKAIGRMP